MEGAASELGKREEEIEALAAALAQKDAELARMADELGSRGTGGGGGSPAVVAPEDSPMYQSTWAATGSDCEIATSMDRVAAQAAEVEQQKNTISELQVH